LGAAFSGVAPLPGYNMRKVLNILRGNRGIALLITLSITTILVAAALEYNRRARFEVLSTAAVRDRATLSQMAVSGIHVAMALLVKDKMESNFDSLQEDWANPEKINEILQELAFEQARLTVVISDELSRIQVNALVTFPDGRQFNAAQVLLWDRFLRYIGNADEIKEDQDPVAIVNSVKDWLDSHDDDATTGLSGAESSYYEDLDPSYACRNGPIRDLNELLLIKGITPGMFYGSGEKPGLEKYMTVYGMTPTGASGYTWPGRININTADLPVLAALMPPESVDLAQALYEYRQQLTEEKNPPNLSSSKWPENIAGLRGLGIDSRLITTSSDVFRVVAEAVLNETRLTATAVVQRLQNAKTGKWTCRILNRQIQ